MTEAVRIQPVPEGMWTIGPDIVEFDEAGIDTAVLEVSGGHLSWNLLGDTHTPAAVIDDVARAQEWIWAIYGEVVSVALADGAAGDFAAAPAVPEVARNARRLAYALWASRWWPASTIDAIPPLDRTLLSGEIVDLVSACDLLVDDDFVWDEPLLASKTSSRADDYALAAGSVTALRPEAVTLARGTGGTDWRRCPPGMLDASERAVSWEIVREPGRTIARVEVVAAPDADIALPEHIRPRATVDGVGIDLSLAGDVWRGEALAPDAGSEASVTVVVPGFGVHGRDEVGGRMIRDQVRDMVRRRLSNAAADDLLLAEVAAAGSDTDF
ncbi:hypothetical protein [Antrihabitans sp. YC2-6]|uniref:hypothetical protein n=1 Tax=Antrihabitans sp. YC2-6 TaxID=2799498 RepID=UPI0018F4C5DB|nr:hypothetical protein [Antrihabitans sp. YC2-6]MBJ8346581.1 hypothetical protein [Antrihabitans sp. YC2-6]